MWSQPLPMETLDFSIFFRGNYVSRIEHQGQEIFILSISTLYTGQSQTMLDKVRQS